MPHGGTRIGARGSFLHICERDTGVETGDERVPERVRPGLLGQSGAAGDPAGYPPGAVPVQPFPGRCDEGRLRAAFADRQVDGAGGPRGERDDGLLAALRVIARVRCPRSVPRASMSARQAASRRSCRWWHQAVNGRRSGALASRVSPLYPARNPADASRSWSGEYRLG